MRILANDGISQKGYNALKEKGFSIITEKIDQKNIIDYINKEKIEVLLVRSATKVGKDILDSCPSIKVIGRGGVGMDNIDVEHARKKNITTFNTPSASSTSVAELVFTHLFSMTRYLFDSNRKMPLYGDSEFKKLKSNYSNGKELFGKNLGIIGFGRIGKEVARIAIGIGMNIIVHDKFISNSDIELKYFNGETKKINIKTVSMDTVLKESDFITLHIPKSEDNPIIGANEIGKMKNGSGIINASRGGIIDEDALMFALDKEKLSYAGLDVYNNEPKPSIHLMMHNAISLTPHIGAATIEAQEKIGLELAEQICSFYNIND
ncbi:MAG: 3-phosphoglycerate dehydrogenase [Flavobacteriales bacterium]|nr:3-phosphoglycerate dehydrogenase [Flavobacteriales bacterium]